MIYFLFALAVAIQPGELYYDELGCRWRAAPAAALAVPAKAAPRPASAPSAPAPRARATGKPSKPKARPSYAQPAPPEDEFIGCDGPPRVVTSALPEEPVLVTTIDIDTFEPVPELPPPPFLELAAPEVTFETGIPPPGFPSWGFPGIFIGGPIQIVVVAAPVATPIPESPVVVLFAIGLLGLVYESRRSKGVARQKRQGD